jgi:hypothetical protein
LLRIWTPPRYVIQMLNPAVGNSKSFREELFTTPDELHRCVVITACLRGGS